ncbi:Glycosyl transferase family 2 [Desulfofundulus australicus DSM 11792]|uniref:dolichyl-phosphate beta-glucosyltransferase n=1 Tax=Desulfofundulus australicus DSM 11792 TaxID=1121425 RepID=A0A1M4XV02_9FIRM|nr:dolichyl-phosphate beta-glucosyltransferase [Desulfofundulus australicus]SHE97248.1 Glycosyl transferase family 2 [Desulfofundulus australicus DSM 11792]
MLSVVIPAYNEETRLPGALGAVMEYLAGREHEIVVVDDGSSDRTAEIAEKFGCRVVRHPRNLGKGAAVKTGVIASRGELVLVTDADLAAPVTELSKLKDALERGADIAIGSRDVPGARVRRASLKRKLAGRLFNLLVRLLTELPHRDTQCGFKLFRGDSARLLFSLAECRGYCFDVEVLLLAREMGFKVEEVGVSWTDVPGSKVRLFKDGCRMFGELVQIRRRSAGNSFPATPGTSAPESTSSPVS